MYSIAIYISLTISFLFVSSFGDLRGEVRSNFQHLVQEILRHKCPSDLDKNFKLNYPVEVRITTCDLDLEKESAVVSTNGSSYLLQKSAPTGEIIFHSHPSARGLCNQIEFNSAFLQWSRAQNKAILPPIFHMDGYNTTNDYLLPFSFIYDRASFYEGTLRDGIRVVQGSETISRRKAVAIKSLGRNCLSVDSRCIGMETSQLNNIIIRADHWKRPSPDLISFPLSKYITTAVDPIVNHFRHNGHFLSLHFRVEIATSNRETWARNADFGGLEDTLQNVSTILQQYLNKGGISRNIYVASYLPQDHTSFKALKRATPGFSIFTKFDFFPRDIEREPVMTRNMLALVEFSVLERAELFIGNCRSSFSRTIALRRNPISHPSVWTFPCERK